jgi:hypothetical protein
VYRDDTEAEDVRLRRRVPRSYAMSPDHAPNVAELSSESAIASAPGSIEVDVDEAESCPAKTANDAVNV